MRNLLLLLLLIPMLSFSQEMDCDILYSSVINDGRIENHYKGMESSFLEEVTYYSLGTEYFVVVEFKKSGRQYLYGSTYSDMMGFHYYSDTDQAGEAFHEFIEPNTIRCE